MAIIFHITATESWKAAQPQGAYLAPSLETEGFIHCSTGEQVRDVANARFKGKKNLVLLAIDEQLVTPEIKYEGPAASPFPHIYGPLNVNAVIKTFEFQEGPQGFELPLEASRIND